MSKKFGILMWVIFFTSIVFHSILQDRFLQTDQSIDPTQCLFDHLEGSRKWVNEQLLPQVLSLNPDDFDQKLALDRKLENRHLSVDITKNGNTIYRSNAINEFAICDTLFAEAIKINRCVGLLDNDFNLHEEITRACHLFSAYTQSDNGLGQTIHFGDQELNLIQIQKENEGHNHWLLFPFFTTLIILLLQAFFLGSSRSKLRVYPVLLSLMAAYHLIPLAGIEKIGWQMPTALIVFFAGMFFWRKHHLLLPNNVQKLGISSLGILGIFSLTLLNIQSSNIYTFLDNPFEAFNKISWSEIYIFASSLLLLFVHVASLHQSSMLVRRQHPTRLKRWMYLGGMAALHSLLVFLIMPNFPLIPTVLSVAIYFLLIDLFSEGKQNPVIWSILWSVFMSVMISAGIYFQSFSSTIEKVVQKIENEQFSTVDEAQLKQYTGTEIPVFYAEEIAKFKNIGVQHFFKNRQIHFVNHHANGDVDVLSYRVPGLIKGITMFSFVFLMGISLYFLMTLMHQKVNILPRQLQPGDLYKASFSRRIQTSYLLLTVISFISIAAITIFLLNNYFKNNERENLKNSLNLIKSQLVHLIEEHEQDSDLLTENIHTIEKLNKLNIELYDENGMSITSNGFISQGVIEYLEKNPEGSLNKVENNQGFESYVHLGNKDFAFATINGISGRNQSSLSIYDFIAGILNVYVFLFIIAISFGLFVSKSIVDPLSRLASKMQQLRLGKENQLVEWKGQGEVGSLIENYNEMVMKLEESANLIATTERDMAWREMARQVAHEIKNPLTPMKLRLQYLQKQINLGKTIDSENLERISTTLLEQINNLSNISEAFSNVAKLPNASNEKVILNEVVESVHDLFRKREDMHIKLTEPINDLIVFADKNHLVRILNNMVKNAIESIPDERVGMIEISLSKQVNDAVIRVTDNGIGIPRSMQSKIFTPKFTTKNSGSGLGLAIAQNMAESFNARLYFDSKEGVGTSFYLRIPLMKLVANKEDNRVILE